MRSISHLTVFAALFGVGLPAHANPHMSPTSPAPPPASAPAASAQTQVGLLDAPRASVAAIMVDAGQALLWDGVRGEYVLVRPGESFQQFQITAVEAEQVVLSRGNQHFVLPRTSETSDLTRRRTTAAVASPAVQSREQVVDPYAADPVALQPTGGVAPAAGPVMGMVPLDPYGAYAQGAAASSNDGLAPAEAPAVLDPYASEAAVPAAPALPSSLLESRAKPLPDTDLEPSARVVAGGKPRVTAVPRPVIQPQGEATSLRDERHTVSRKEFDAAIADFNALAREVRVSLVADGVRVEELAPGSLPHRMGLRTGDVVLSVDGKALRNMNDAASIYARLMDAEQFLVKVHRGTGIITMRYRFTR